MKRLAIILALLLPVVASAASEEARLLRFPAVGGDNIVFSYAGDLYRVGIDGGTAVKLTSHVGYEMFPRISPDGKTIAFTGQYDGNTEVYTMPIEGGEPKRVTYSALVSRDMVGERMGPNNIVMCWTPDGKQIVYRSKWHNFSGLRGQLCKVPAEGGVAEQIPTTEGGFCSYSPDGKYLAMNRMFREFRTWKYYRGGQADDIWIHKVGTTKCERIEGCSPESQDIFPMWVGNEIFYLSDRDRTMNLFVYDTSTKKTEKVTDFTEYDCKFPSYSKDWIVFENGGYIYKFSVKDRTCTKVTIYLADDGIYGRPELKSVSDKTFAYSLSPDGERLLIIARGDLYSAPAKQGPVYNITRSCGAHEREGVWSPDGKRIAYFSDKDGEYQVYVAPSDDMENARQMTFFKTGYPTGLKWSPDSGKLYFSTEQRDIYQLDVNSGALDRILVSETSGFRGFTLSYDGAWAAYSQSLSNDISAIFLYEVATGKSYQVTDRWYDASSPIFSQDGKYLFFTSSREFRPQYSAVEWNASYSVSDYVFVLPLAKGTPDPTAVKSNEYSAAADAPAKDAKVDRPERPEKPGMPDRPEKPEKPSAKPQKSVTKVDIDGIGQRISALPLPAGRYRLVLAANDKLYYTQSGGMGMPGGPMPGGPNAGGLKSIDMKNLKTGEAGEFPVTLTPDLKKALYRSGGKFYVAPFGMGFKNEKPVPTEGLQMVVDHKAEWNQIFDESWRIFRDYFYVTNMHGVDWPAIHDKYAVMLPYVKHRHDLTYLIGEMIGELSIGHAYITSGECPEIPRVATGLLGGKFSRNEKTGAFRIEKIFKGANWDKSLRSPLTEPGVDAKVGEFIVKVNGIPSSELTDIYEALVGKVDQTVSLEISPKADGSNSRTVYVKPVGDESQLAYYEWVQGNIEKVDKASNGEIGYIHIPDMSAEGLTMFTKLFYTQLDKKALIIDDRMNGGGNVSPMILERLQREVYRMSMYRNGSNKPVPNEAFYGPVVCLIDKYSSSDGDLFPYGFRKAGVGKLIGKRSWGGIVGISGSKAFVDGQDMRTPFFTSYGLDGEWIIEGHGVDPDIEVDINPFEDYKCVDAQLNKAIEVLKSEMKDYAPLPPTPAAPVKNADTWNK